MAMDQSIVGDLINFRGLVYAPINENGVIFLFGKVAHDLNMYVEEIKPGFPDCVARRFIGKGWAKVRVEFEYKSSNFQLHKHNHKDCDIIVCWIHDWKECPIEVIELSSEIKGFENSPIARPEAIEAKQDKIDDKINKILKSVDADKNVGLWFSEVFNSLKKMDQDIWANPGEIYIGLYSPEKSFASVKLQSKTIRIECFSRGIPIEGTKVASDKFSPRWVKFSIKTPSDVTKAVDILKTSIRRLKDAIKNGEPTAYYSGGYFSGNTIEHISEEDK